MSQCAECRVYACRQERVDITPANCPTLSEGPIYDEVKKEYRKPENLEIALNAAVTESEGYCKWTRLEEIVEFSRRAGFITLGLAFCVGQRKEAAQVAKILKSAGFRVESVMCKTGSVLKEFLGVQEDAKVRAGGSSNPCATPCAKLSCLIAQEVNSTFCSACAWAMTLYS